RLDHAGDPGGGLEVADVGLDRADRQRRVGRTIAAERLGQRGRLDRIADRGVLGTFCWVGRAAGG
ncbi:MAG TPA: hypothetical protein PKE20_12570, partial [Promineifilum sp.]|nr:hypothetical protein [Promineifilum sp.]